MAPWKAKSIASAVPKIQTANSTLAATAQSLLLALGMPLSGITRIPAKDEKRGPELCEASDQHNAVSATSW